MGVARADVVAAAGSGRPPCQEPHLLATDSRPSASQSHEPAAQPGPLCTHWAGRSTPVLGSGKI